MLSNCSLHDEWVINIKDIESDWMKKWGNNSFRTFVRLHPLASREAAEANMKGIYPRHTDMEHVYPVLQPLQDYYLYTRFENGQPSGGRIDYVRILDRKSTRLNSSH